MKCAACGTDVSPGVLTCPLCDTALPGSPHPPAVEPFIGRGREWKRLRAALAEARTKRTRIVAACGAAGIGKTRLIERLCDEARHQDFLVLAGRCHEGEGAPPLWPITQMLHSLPSGDAIAEELLARGSEQPASIAPAMEPDHRRFRLFVRLARHLSAGLTERPALLFLDDLHWADPATLAFLEFFVRQAPARALLVSCTYRPGGVRRTTLSSTLGAVRRHPGFEEIELAAFSENEVATYLERLWGHRPPPATIRTIYRRSEGNPLFLHEVALFFAPAGPGAALPRPEEIDTLPRGVRHLVERRISVLSERTRDLLRLAAVLDQDIEPDLLAELTGEPVSGPEALLAEACRAGILEAREDAAGTCRFTHVLLRDVLYQGIPGPQRVEKHARILEILERHRRAGLSCEPGLLAYHARHSARDPDSVLRAVHLSIEAAEAARSGYACETAAEHYRTALTLIARLPDFAPGERRRLLLRRGEALWLQGDTERANEAFSEALERARRDGAAADLAGAALGLAGSVVLPGPSGDPHRDLLEEAYRRLPAKETALRSRLLARLALGQRHLATPAEMDRLTTEAIELARTSADVATRGFALRARRICLWGPDDLAPRRDIAREMIELGAATGMMEIERRGVGFSIADELESGDVHALRKDVQRYASLARDLGLPEPLWWSQVFNAMRALLSGPLAEAEREVERAFTLGQGLEAPGVGPVYAAQMLTLRREQGRLGDIAAAIRAMASSAGGNNLWEVPLALVLVESGQPAQAAEIFAKLARDDFHGIARDWLWLSKIYDLADVCVALGEVRHAAILREILLPYSDRIAVRGGAVVCQGSVWQALARLDALCGASDRARGEMERALDCHCRLGASVLEARSREYLGNLLSASAVAGEREAAARLLAEAAEAVARLGLSPRAENPESSTIAPASVAAPGRQTTPVPAADPVFRREAEYWTICYANRVCRLRDSKGMRYLALLLGCPGREIHALDMVHLIEQAGESGERHAPAEPISDAQAIASYREHLTDLRVELAEAEEFHDLGRSTRLRQEMAAVEEQIALSYGLGGRSRKIASAAERARARVTKVIRSAVQRIATAHRDLGEHLDATLHTGTFFSYTPDPRVPVAWRISGE